MFKNKHDDIASRVKELSQEQILYGAAHSINTRQTANLRLLLSEMECVNTPMDNNVTLLMIASSSGNLTAVSMLTDDFKASLDEKSSGGGLVHNGFTALDFAYHGQHLEVANFILSRMCTRMDTSQKIKQASRAPMK